MHSLFNTLILFIYILNKGATKVLTSVSSCSISVCIVVRVYSP